MTKTNGADLEKAKSILAHERQQRLEELQARIESLLKEAGCALVAEPYIDQEGKIRTRIHVQSVKV